MDDPTLHIAVFHLSQSQQDNTQTPRQQLSWLNYHTTSPSGPAMARPETPPTPYTADSNTISTANSQALPPATDQTNPDPTIPDETPLNRVLSGSTVVYQPPLPMSNNNMTYSAPSSAHQPQPSNGNIRSSDECCTCCGRCCHCGQESFFGAPYWLICPVVCCYDVFERVKVCCQGCCMLFCCCLTCQCCKEDCLPIG